MLPDNTCESKPEGVEANNEGTTLETLNLRPGFYRFSSGSNGVYACPTYANCKGGKIQGNTSVADSLCRKGSGVFLQAMLRSTDALHPLFVNSQSPFSSNVPIQLLP